MMGWRLPGDDSAHLQDVAPARTMRYDYTGNEDKAGA